MEIGWNKAFKNKCVFKRAAPGTVVLLTGIDFYHDTNGFERKRRRRKSITVDIIFFKT